MKLNPKTTVHDGTHNVKYRQTDTLDEPLFLNSLKMSQMHCFKVTRLLTFDLF